ncbi:MAG: hypothetical protein JEZ07_04370 [Phycisphaerae bacterium]|nr:hypothetical protein [Phycisphaerae bacterium]
MVKERIKSLDVFRGAVMASMILVENPGCWNAYQPLRHAAQGARITPTDFIFPLFIFIMGIAVPLSLSKWRNQEGVAKEVFSRIIRRTIILFALGTILKIYSNLVWLKFDLSEFEFSRGMCLGVLQKIAITYLVTSIIYFKFNTKTIFASVIILLLGYWAMLTLIPVEGFDPPGFDREHNIVTMVDIKLLGRPTAEGILSTIPTVISGLLGVLTGILIIRPKDKNAKFKILMLSGLATTALGLLWGQVFSIEKDLWTSSYALYTGGVGLLLMGLFLWIIDILKFDKWIMPFQVYGANCITVYFCSHLLAYTLWFSTATLNGQKVSLLEKLMVTIFGRWFKAPFQSPMASLIFSLAIVLMWFIPLLIMFRKKIIIKI